MNTNNNVLTPIAPRTAAPWSTTYLQLNTSEDGDEEILAAAEGATTIASIANVDSPSINTDSSSSVQTINQTNSFDSNDVLPLVAEENVRALPLVAEENLRANGNNPKVLMAMLHGVVDEDGQTCANIEREPYHLLQNKKNFVPTNIELRHEVVRRAKLYEPNVNVPRPSGWNTNKIKMYLDRVKIPPGAERFFLIKEEKELRDIQRQAILEKQQRQLSSVNNEVRFRFNQESIMRLTMAILQDGVRERYVERYSADDRSELDARNSDLSPSSVEEEISSLMNSTDFAPSSWVLPRLHSDFRAERDLSYEACMRCDVTATQVKSKLADLKVNLCAIITRWEASGNGDGNKRTCTDSDFGHFDSEHQDDNRSDYLHSNCPSLLYFWHGADFYDLILSSITTLDSSQACNSSSIPVTTTARKRKNKEKERQLENNNETMKRISKALIGLSKESLINRLSCVRDQILKYMVMMDEFPEDSPRYKTAKMFLEETEENKKELQEELDNFEDN
jgi:hypothetical protein